MTTPEAALAAALREVAPNWPISHVRTARNEGFAAELETALHDAGYALTPLAPEVPPGNERARAVTLATWALDRAGADPDDDLAVIARQFLREIERAAARTPEPPDSGDGAAPDPLILHRALWNVLGWQARYNPGRTASPYCETCGRGDFSTYDPIPVGIESGDIDNPAWADLTQIIAAEYARLRAAAPAPEGGE